jgi:3-oxoacyl-[acyl-carrier protein] reductase
VDLGLRGRVAVVLAASRGLGRATAESLAKEGCHVAICARNPLEIQSVAQAIAKHTGSNILGLPCDVANPEALEQFFKIVQARFGCVDILVNNSGGPPPGTFETSSDGEWLNACDLTLMSVIRACRYVVPAMKERRWGRILNITSVSVKHALPGMILSNTFRPAVAGLARSMADELAPFGVLVHCLLPGSFLTDRNRKLGGIAAQHRGIEFEKLVQEWERSVPLGRMGKPSEFGELVAFLASERCSFATGTCFVIDGGQIKSLF